MSSAFVVDVSEDTFLAEVVERSKEVPVVVDFWAEWCGPCKTLGPLLEAEAEARQGAFVLAKIDVDRAQTLAMQFRVQSIPYVVAFVDGRPSFDFMGVVSKPDLVRFLEQVIEAGPGPKEPEPEIPADPAEAEAAYRKTLEEEPRDPAANVGLAGILLAQGEDAAAKACLSAINLKKADDFRDDMDRLGAILSLRALGAEAGALEATEAALAAAPADAECLYAHGCALSAASQYPEALAALLAAGQADRSLARGKVREAMVHVFYVVGPRDPLADEYRDKLTDLVF